MAKILLTAGPIPARVDSVKYITNRFKGGLAFKTAEQLFMLGHDVTLMGWEHAPFTSGRAELLSSQIGVVDVHDYVEKVLAFEADAYVLAAAVANIGPSVPMTDKFPSHNYKVGDTFPIEFTILPRVIDRIKAVRPRATLIGYKLFDSNEALIEAGRHTLHDSKANLVFANHPVWAKERKIVLTQDGAAFHVTFDNHVRLIDQLVRDTFYRTIVMREWFEDAKAAMTPESTWISEHYPKYPLGDMVFGTWAARIRDNEFLTTTRGKRQGTRSIAFVGHVDHAKHTIFASDKATLNAPLLHRLLELNPQVNYLIHGHEKFGLGTFRLIDQYQFPGTVGDNQNASALGLETFIIDLPNHGYVAGFKDFNQAQTFCESHGKI